MMKAAAEEDVETRVRRCWLASALVAFSQGVAFFHAGDEILRSKSLDRDSYNSGDIPWHIYGIYCHYHLAPHAVSLSSQS